MKKSKFTEALAISSSPLHSASVTDNSTTKRDMNEFVVAILLFLSLPLEVLAVLWPALLLALLVAGFVAFVGGAAVPRLGEGVAFYLGLLVAYLLLLLPSELSMLTTGVGVLVAKSEPGTETFTFVMAPLVVHLLLTGFAVRAVWRRTNERSRVRRVWLANLTIGTVFVMPQLLGLMLFFG